MLINKKFKPEINVRHFVSSNDYKNRSRDVIEEKSINNEIVFSESLADVFDLLKIDNGMTISFHHHGHKKTYQDVYLFFFKPCGLNLKMNSCYVPKDLFDRIEVGDPIFVAYNKFFPVPFNAYQGTYTGNYFYTIDVR